jgi:hypothetical protein
MPVSYEPATHPTPAIVSSSRPALPSGTVLDCYRLSRQIGSGGFSLIYLAEDAGFLVDDSSDRLRRQVGDVRRLIEGVRRAVMHYEGLEETAERSQ